VAHYLDASELGIRQCVSAPELGCWLDVCCPLQENLWPLRSTRNGWKEYASDPPSLVTQRWFLTHLALSLERHPREALVLRVLLDVMAASVWSRPLPAAARLVSCGLPPSSLGHPSDGRHLVSAPSGPRLLRGYKTRDRLQIGRADIGRSCRAAPTA